MPFSAGLVAGGVTSGAAWWLMSRPLPDVPPGAAVAVLVGVAAVLFLRDTGVVRFGLPQARRQIPSDVLRTGRHLQFGFAMGTGVRTYVTATAPYLLLLALAMANPGWGSFVAAGAGFGLGRVLTPVLRFASLDDSAWDRSLARVEPFLVPLSGAGLALAVVLSYSLG